MSGLALVIADIKAHPGRERQSVVLLPGGSKDQITPDEANRDADLKKIFKAGIDQLLELGVPFVCAAGNFGESPNRDTIDTAPAVFQSTETPIIVVGSAENDGSQSSFSQGGSQLTIYAPGREIEVQSLVDFQPTKKSGTSYGKHTKLDSILPHAIEAFTNLASQLHHKWQASLQHTWLMT
jgi:hypothetical protein